MGQVPNANSRAQPHPAPSQILLIGNGRLAKALAHVGAQSTFYSHWFRASGSTFAEHLAALEVANFRPTHVWLAISDTAIKNFVEQHASLFLRDGHSPPTFVHFAGALPTLTISGLTVHAVHPLMTFRDVSTGALQSAASLFSTAPVILDKGGPNLETLMPGCTNTVHRIDPAQRPYYHALCAIAGNFSVLLWEAVAQRFESDLGVSAKALEAYRDQIFQNLSTVGALTGPLARNDTQTLAAHRAALFQHAEIPLLKIYDGFTDLYRTDREKVRPEKELK